MEGKRNYGQILAVGFGLQKPLRFMLLFFHLWFVLRAAVGLQLPHCGAARVFTQSCRQTPRVAPWGFVFGKAPLAVRVSVMAVPGSGASIATIGDVFEAPTRTKPVPLFLPGFGLSALHIVSRQDLSCIEQKYTNSKLSIQISPAWFMSVGPLDTLLPLCPCLIVRSVAPPAPRAQPGPER